MRKMSVAQLSERTEGQVSINQISRLEKNVVYPSSSVLISIARALNLRVDYFFRTNTVNIDHVEFRKRKSFGRKETDALREDVRDRVERYLEIESLLGLDCPSFKGCQYKVQTSDDVIRAAKSIKKEWQLGEDGISNVIEVVEDHGVIVIEVQVEDKFDGMGGFVSGRPFIVVNNMSTSERKRFTTLHELAHLVLDIAEGIDAERMCNDFANEMLMSKEEFISKIGDKRKDISLEELRDIQRHYGISPDALMTKAHNLGVISDNRYKTFNVKKNMHKDFGHKVREGLYAAETSFRFERLVFKAIACNIISESKGAALLNTQLSEIKSQLSLV